MKVPLVFLHLLSGALVLPSVLAQGSDTENCVLDFVGQDLQTLAPQYQNMDQINFFAFRKRTAYTFKFYKLNYGNETQAKEVFNEDMLFIYVYFHDVGRHAATKWINESKNHLMGSKYQSNILVISIGYKDLVMNIEQAVRNAETISNHTAVFFDWAFKFTDHIEAYRKRITFIGHGIGANIASLTAERMLNLSSNTRMPYIVLALDPEFPNKRNSWLLPSCYQYPAIRKNSNYNVHVWHTSSCFQKPVIQACNSTLNATVGNVDFFINGGSIQSGCSDLSCSRDRVTLIYLDVVSLISLPVMTSLFAIECPNYTDFQLGKCGSCNFSCPEMSQDFPARTSGRFYLYTNSISPYGRGRNATAP